MSLRPAVLVPALILGVFGVACGDDEDGASSSLPPASSVAPASDSQAGAQTGAAATDTPSPPSHAGVDANTLNDHRCPPHGENTRVHGTFTAVVDGEAIGPFNVHYGGHDINFGIHACDVGRIVGGANLPNWEISMTTRDIGDHAPGSVEVGPDAPIRVGLDARNPDWQPGGDAPEVYRHQAEAGGSATVTAFAFVGGTDSERAGTFAGEAVFETNLGSSVQLTWDVSWSPDN